LFFLLTQSACRRFYKSFLYGGYNSRFRAFISIKMFHAQDGRRCRRIFASQQSGASFFNGTTALL